MVSVWSEQKDRFGSCLNLPPLTSLTPHPNTGATWVLRVHDLSGSVARHLSGRHIAPKGVIDEPNETATGVTEDEFHRSVKANFSCKHIANSKHIAIDRLSGWRYSCRQSIEALKFPIRRNWRHNRSEIEDGRNSEGTRLGRVKVYVVDRRGLAAQLRGVCVIDLARAPVQEIEHVDL